MDDEALPFLVREMVNVGGPRGEVEPRQGLKGTGFGGGGEGVDQYNGCQVCPTPPPSPRFPWESLPEKKASVCVSADQDQEWPTDGSRGPTDAAGHPSDVGWGPTDVHQRLSPYGIGAEVTQTYRNLHQFTSICINLHQLAGTLRKFTETYTTYTRKCAGPLTGSLLNCTLHQPEIRQTL